MRRTLVTKRLTQKREEHILRMALRMVAADSHFMLRPWFYHLLRFDRLWFYHLLRFNKQTPSRVCYDDGDEEDFTRRVVMQHLIDGDEQHFVLAQLGGYQLLTDGAHFRLT